MTPPLNCIALLLFILFSNVQGHSLPTVNRMTSSASIYFNSKGTSNLQVFINGQKIAEGKGSVRRALNQGDVIAVRATHSSGDFGVAISINAANEKALVTGKAKWLATNRKSLPSNIGNSWMQKSYDACSWPQADFRSSKKEKVPTFPADTAKLNYVWAGDAGPREEVYFRYVYKVNTCKMNFKQRIFYASQSGAELYVNQKRISTLDKVNQFRRISTKVKPGDTVAIVSPRSSKKSGVIAVVKLNKKVNFTTGSVGWKAAVNNQLSSLGNNDLCVWPDAQAFSPTPTYNWLKNFRKFKATYIQTRNVVATNNFFPKQHFRLTVGNTQDSCRTYDARIYYAIQIFNEGSLFINGQRISTETSNKVTQFTRRELKVGDVVSFRASGNDILYYGLAAVIDLGNSNFQMTGQSNWRARSIKGSTAQQISTWMSPQFNPCSWSADDLSIGAFLDDAVINRFPAPVRKKVGFSWAGEAGRNDPVLIRYKVGGESCPKLDNRIYYAVQIENKARLFVNGKQISIETDQFRTKNVRYDLKTGDVVAIQLSSDDVAYYGVAVAIQLDNGYTVTGESNWRARSIQSSNQRDIAMWMSPDFNPCSWSGDDLSLQAFRREEVIDGFPTQIKSRVGFVWAGEAERTAPVLLRYRVGGEKCPKFDNRIYYAVQNKNEAKLFVNGKQISIETDQYRIKNIRYDLKNGDVVVIQVSTLNPFYGVAAAIQLGNARFAVTGESMWRGRSIKNSNKADLALWMSQQFNPCSWRRDVASTRSVLREEVRDGLPPSVRTRVGFVWVGGVPINEAIILRYRVGGERC